MRLILKRRRGLRLSQRKMAGTEAAASRTQEVPRERDDALTSSGHRLTPMYGSGYQTSEMTASQNATRSSSPGSGSFHTANPMDSRSEQSSLSGEEEEDGEGKDELSVEIPSLEDVKTPLASYQAPVGQGRAIKGKEEEEEDANVTLQAEASGHSVGGGGGRGRPYQTEQPKLLLAESETVAPCPEKRPLAGPHHPSHGHHQEEVHETTPLLPPRGQSSSHSEEEGICCSCVVL